jgi:hypothetical protein
MNVCLPGGNNNDDDKCVLVSTRSVWVRGRRGEAGTREAEQKQEAMPVRLNLQD